MYRHRFLREGQEERQLMVLDTAYRRVALPGGDGWESLGRAWADSLATAASRELNVAQQNLLSEELNRRIARALNVALDNNCRRRRNRGGSGGTSRTPWSARATSRPAPCKARRSGPSSIN